MPIAFTSDHIETLFEIDIEYKEEAEEVGHYFGAGAGGTTAKKPQTARLASAATTKSALECPVCNTKFANPFNARRHMVNKHGMTAPVALAQLPAMGE